MEKRIKQRDYTWDVLKFPLIVLVILGHWLQYNYKSNTTNLVVYNYRSLFTIPLFVFISGYFSRKKDKKEFFKDIIHLFETYLMVQILYLVSSYFLLHKPITWQAIYIPKAAAWFLLSLLSWRVLLQAVPECYWESKWAIPACVVLSLASGFIPISMAFSMQRTIAFLSFFVCGYYLKRRIRFGFTPPIKKGLCVSILIIVFVCSFFVLDRDISFVTWCKFCYNSYPTFLPWTLLLLRALYLLVAAVMMFCILKLFPHVQNPILLSQLGSDTLFYYVYHIPVMWIGITLIRHYHLSLEFPAMMCYTLVSLMLLYLMGKVRLFRWLLNPITSILDN